MNNYNDYFMQQLKDLTNAYHNPFQDDDMNKYYNYDVEEPKSYDDASKMENIVHGVIFIVIAVLLFLFFAR